MIGYLLSQPDFSSGYELGRWAGHWLGAIFVFGSTYLFLLKPAFKRFGLSGSGKESEQ